MKRETFALDTSVAVPLLMLQHPAHASVDAWSLDRELCLTAHSLAETYSVLTRLHGAATIPAGDAVRMIDDRFSTVLALEASTTVTVHKYLAQQQISGGAVYDALVALAAKAHGAILATRDNRARGTYAALGVDTVVVGGPPR